MRKRNLKIFILSALTFLGAMGVRAQTDTEFWFVVPEVTINHQFPGGQPASFRIATGLLPATVTISMPANQFDPVTNPTGFPDIVINMPANSFHIEDLTCWIMNPCTPPGGTSADVNKLENKPLNASGINKFGILITSTNDITVYWEVSRQNNKDIWALKGSNALGTDFYVPFQTHRENANVIADTPSAIDVVATEDNTVVTFQLPPGIQASYGNPMINILPGGSYNVTLNRGETFSLFPVGKSRTAANRLRGTRVTSTKPIAITVKDDSFYHTAGGCYDIAGDQLIPTNIAGMEYAVIRTFLNNHDHIYILGTQNGTNVTVYNTAGGIVATTTVGAQQQLYYQLPDGQTYYRIVADQPVYVWHVGGFGCEQGGAILPPIDICTGSTQVAFARTSSENFYVILMVRQGAEDSIYFDGVIRNDLFPPASFNPLPVPSKWSVARYGPFTTAQIAVGSHFMENTEDIFHLGIVNGGGATGCFYGYFSDYNELNIQAVVAGTSSSVLKTCYGNPVQLYATGGTTYRWWPGESLSDSTSQLTWATPLVNTKYYVEVSGACDMKDTATIDVLVSTPLTASFITDRVEGCAPLEVTFEDKSDSITYWRYDFGDGSAYLKYDTDGATPDPPPPSPFTFTHTFQNNTDSAINYKVVLLAKNADYCSEVYEKYITVYPSINADFNPKNHQGCNPQTVTFTNSSSSNTADTYLWEFGDGMNEVTNNPSGQVVHTFTNSVPYDTTYQMRMIATSPFMCRDTATASITIYSYFNADFAVDVSSGCSPVTVNIDNLSVGDTARYEWRRNGTLFKTTGRDTTLILTNTTNTYIDYIIELKVFNGGDRCSQTVTHTVRVYPEVNAAFTTPQGQYCNLSNVVFTNTTSPTSTNPGGVVNTYSWDFGDGASSSLFNPTHVYDNQTDNFKDYIVTLTARNQFGCEDVATDTIRIFSQIYADFAVTPAAKCSPDTANIDNNSRGGIVVVYNWNYGDGSPTSGTNLDHTHIYVNNGLTPVTRTITLTVTNEGGCTDTEQHDVTIYPSVTAGFTADITQGCNELSVSFTNTSKANATIFSWDFGDGGSSVEPSPSHTFVNLTGSDVTYPVNLTVTTDYGCTDQTSTNITVYPYIDAQFAIDTSFGCSPLEVRYVYTKHPGITEYRWDWDGNGTTDTTTFPAAPNSLSHIFVNQTGAVQNLPTRLTVVNSHCSKTTTSTISVYPEVTATFNPSIDQGCNPLDVGLNNTSTFTGGATLTNAYYYWDFGDGGSSTAKSPNHTYINNDAINNVTYNTRLRLVSEYGCTDSAFHDIEVYNRVESHFTLEHAENCTPFDVTFQPEAIGASQYIWTYGGAPGLPASETFANGNTFTRTFTNNDPNNTATYTVTLEARNNEGCPAFESHDVQVYPIVTAKFDRSDSIGCSDLTVDLISTSTGGSLVYLWDLGNGQSSSTANVTHTFTNRGSVDSIYYVKLKVINPLGCLDSITHDVTVHPKVEAQFVFAQQSQCTPFYIDLANTSLNGNSFHWITHYNGDTLTTNKNSFQYLIDNTTLNDILTDTIKLVSLDAVTGCTDSTYRTLTIYPRVVSNFDVDKVQGCNPLTVNFTNNSSGLSTYLWEFDDGATSANDTPDPHTYSHPNKNQSVNYTAKLTATNAFGCKSQKDTVITVYPLVKADFQWDLFEGCTPLTINLSNSSTSPQYKYRWDFGDGRPYSYDPQPDSVTYTNPTISPPEILFDTITLRTSYSGDTLCIDSLKLPVRVFPHIYPDFSGNLEGCHPLTVNFENQTVPFSPNNSYTWSLGTGVNSLEEEPVHTYNNTDKFADSTFIVKMVAVSEHGCTDSVTHEVIAHPRPYAAMELVGEYISCPPFDVEIDNNSLGTDLTFKYDFGDGTDSTTINQSNMLHTFHNYNNETQPYQIKLRTVTEHGCDDSVFQTIYVFPEVVASYAASSYQACSPFEVSFSNSTQNARFYEWDFADGITSSLREPSHTFLNFNETDTIYNVALYASSEFDCFDRDTQQIRVYATPKADIAADPPLQVYPNATFSIYNQGTPAAKIWDYSWSFGDNTTSPLKEPGNHTYTRWGPKDEGFKYRITLKVDAPHCSDADTAYVYLLPTEPVAFFATSKDSACSPMEVNFDEQASYADTYFWEFGDDSTSTERNPQHTYYEPGYYTVKLTVTNDAGSRFYYKILRVYDNPKANFAIYPQKVMLPDATVHAYNLSTQFTRSLWDFGDGTQTDERDPMHTYEKLGEFKVSLWVYMDYGNDVCIDSISKYPAVWVEGMGYIRFPNAFKPSTAGPNGGVYDDIDYKNEVFHPYHFGVVEYKLMIFSRWGEQLFTSTDVKVGWDGYVNGKLAQQGVYMWRAIGKFTNGKPFDMKGNVTLLR